MEPNYKLSIINIHWAFYILAGYFIIKIFPTIPFFVVIPLYQLRFNQT